MNPDKENHLIIKGEDIKDFYLKDNIKLCNAIPLDDDTELISYLDNKDTVDENKDVLNINVSIAASITFYARIYMSRFKLDYKDSLYYSDTDSMDLSIPFFLKRKEFIGDELGKFKLESIFKKVVYIAPKVYGAITEKNKDFVKVKGLKSPIKFIQLKNLLKKNKKIEIHHDKWYKNIKLGNITIKDDLYTLMATDNKRKLVYNEKNILIDTKPLVLESNKIIE